MRCTPDACFPMVASRALSSILSPDSRSAWAQKQRPVTDRFSIGSAQRRVVSRRRALSRGAYLDAADSASGKCKVRRLVEEAWAALERFPDDPGLLLLLGHLFEREGLRHSLARARASYGQAIEVGRWGATKRAAEAALDRLNEDASAP